ncbi:MAG: hypothetical protein HY553_01810 [Elusimicrobia bacterium]|nr:hypothetical protein [Elusimicrobiota bacterium]
MRAVLVFAGLCLLNNRAFWRYALLERGVVTLDTAAALWRHVAVPLGLGVVFALVALGLGRTLLRRIVRGEPGAAESPAAFGLGVLAWAGAVFALGLAGRLTGPALGFTSIAAALVAATELVALSRLRWVKAAAPAPGWQQALWGLLGYALWHSLVIATAPPIEWDILAYHLPIPKLYLAWGGVHEIPWLLHSHWPHLMEAFYVLPLALGEDGLAALIHAACCAGLVAGTFWAARAELGVRTAWLAAAVVAVQPTMLRIAGTAHSDGAVALMQLGATWALWRSDEGRDRRWVLAAALLTGASASCKLFAVAAVPAWAGWLAWRRRWPAAFLFSAASLAVVLPWYVKTAAGAGNPVWPFFSRWLGGAWGASVIETPYLVSTRWPWPPDGELLVRYGPQYLLPSLAAAAFSLGAAARPVPRFAAFCFIPALTYLPIVIRQQEAWRFLLPLYPAMGMLLAVWVGRALDRTGPRRWVALAALGLALWPGVSASQNNELFGASGVRSKLRPDRDPRELYLERSLDHYLPYDRIRRDVPPESRILLYREVRSYYLGLDYLWGDPLNQGLIPYARLATPEALRDRLRALGVTHVLVNDQLAMYAPSEQYYDERITRLMNEMLRLYAAPRVQYGPMSLYRLK